jgi:hypothetical protein
MDRGAPLSLGGVVLAGILTSLPDDWEQRTLGWFIAQAPAQTAGPSGRKPTSADGIWKPRSAIEAQTEVRDVPDYFVKKPGEEPSSRLSKEAEDWFAQFEVPKRASPGDEDWKPRSFVPVPVDRSIAARALVKAWGRAIIPTALLLYALRLVVLVTWWSIRTVRADQATRSHDAA